eukprot:1161964-Pelagomonas_calceolata.AAC.1
MFFVTHVSCFPAARSLYKAVSWRGKSNCIMPLLSKLVIHTCKPRSILIIRKTSLPHLSYLQSIQRTVAIPREIPIRLHTATSSTQLSYQHSLKLGSMWPRLSSNNSKPMEMTCKISSSSTRKMPLWWALLDLTYSHAVPKCTQPFGLRSLFSYFLPIKTLSAKNYTAVTGEV